MGNLSEHFNHQEFFCKCEACKGSNEFKIHLGLVGALELLEIKLGKKVKVRSAFRCEAQNEKVGGGRKSFHIYGKAAHIHVDGMTPQELFKRTREIEEIKGIGLNLDDNTVHVDLRETPAREEWVKDKSKYIPLSTDKKHIYNLE